MNPALLPFYVLTILGQVVVLKLLFAGLVPNHWGSKIILKLVHAYGMNLVLLTTLFSVGGSLYFSEVLHFQPCLLCWWQRIEMYPQLIIAGIGVNNKDNKAYDFIGALSTLGLVTALAHYYIQWGGIDSSCSLAGLVSCADTPFKGFGYITIPLMAATAFAINLLVVWLNKKR